MTKSVACENIRFSSLFAACETSPAAKSEEKWMFSQATKSETRDKQICPLSIIFEAVNSRDKL